MRPKDIRRIEEGEVGRGSHSDTISKETRNDK